MASGIELGTEMNISRNVSKLCSYPCVRNLLHPPRLTNLQDVYCDVR